MVARDRSMEDKDEIHIVNRRKETNPTNFRDSKRVARPPFIPKLKKWEFEEDKGMRKLSFDTVKLFVRHPTPEAKASITEEFR